MYKIKDNQIDMADRLINLRKMKGVTQKEVANAIGINESSYGKYEQGINCPKNKNLKKLADYFEVTPDYIINGTITEPDIEITNLIKDLNIEEKEHILSVIKLIISGYKKE